MKGKKSTKNRRYVFAGIVIVVLALAVAVYFNSVQSSQAGGTQNSQQTIYTPPEGNPSVTVLSPANGDTVTTSSVGVKVNVANFRLAGIVANRLNQQNEGHIHFYLDGGSERMNSLESFAYIDVPDGHRTITVELRNNDHSPLIPPVSASVVFTVMKSVQQIETPPVP